MAFANCDDVDIYNPFGSEPLSKDDLGNIIVFVDIITITILIIFTWGLENGQRIYMNSFNIHTVEMQDFAIKVKNFPDERLYGEGNWDNRDEILRALLSKHFEDIIKRQILIEKKKNLEFDNIASEQSKIWEIADICLGKTDMDEIVEF